MLEHRVRDSKTPVLSPTQPSPVTRQRRLEGPDGPHAQTHLGYAKHGQKEGTYGDTKREEFPVSLQDLEVVRQSCDDCFHASHL